MNDKAEFLPCEAKIILQKTIKVMKIQRKAIRN